MNVVRVDADAALEGTRRALRNGGLSGVHAADLSAVVPLLAKVYPNGSADINHFHAAGGLQFLIGTLLDAGYLHEDVRTVAGNGLHRYRQEPTLDGEKLMWREVPTRSCPQCFPPTLPSARTPPRNTNSRRHFPTTNLKLV